MKMKMQKKQRFTSNLAVLLAGASLGAALPSIAIASPLEERLGSERFEPSRDRRAWRKGTIELAAKKKKRKKKAAGSSGAASGANDASDSDTETSPAGGASDADVQKAARVNPTSSAPDTSSADDSAAKSKSDAKSEGATAASESGPRGPLPRYLDLSVGGQAFSRSLTYHQQVTTTLREYQPRLLGGAVASVVYYPAVHFTDGIATNIGLDLNLSQAFGIQSRTPDGATYPTQIHDYNGGLRVRVPFGSTEPYLTLGYGDHAYKMTGPNRATLILPDTDYRYLRAVLGVRAPLPSNVSLGVSAGYRYVLSPGGIKTDYFPRLTVGGIEANLYIGYAINDILEARIGFDYRRYFFSMHSKNGDMPIVGGAIDQTYGGSLSLAVTLGGTPRAAGVAEESAPAEDAPAPKRKKAKRPKMEGEGATGME
jgi:hypothetical protein